MVAFAMAAMVACGEEENINPGGGDNPGGGTVQTDTTIMNYTLMRSLIDIDWDEACNRVLAMGFFEIESDEGENVRAFMKGSLMGDYYCCYIRCDYPEEDNLVGAVVMQEHHMNSSSQDVCIENEISFINDERRVLSDMLVNIDGCGGNITWGDITSSGQYDTHQSSYPGVDDLEQFVTDLRALDVHTSVNANWADSYTHNGSFYVATCTSVCSTMSAASVMENIITLEKEDNLD